MERGIAWLRAAMVTSGVVIRQAVLSLRQSWGIAILALVLAASLWIYVTDQDDEETTGRVPGPLAVECVNVPPGKADSPPCRDQSVTVRVRAPKDVLDELTAEDFRATADLSDATADLTRVPVRVQPTRARVDIVEISPAQITVRLEDVTSRTVPVRTQLVGTPPRGFEARSFAVQPDEAVVSGPESLVSRVSVAEADVDLTGARTNFEQTLLLQARDDQGGNIEGVNVEPESARVRVEMVQLEFSAPFVVQPDISGAPADGFTATGIQVDPPFVIITGPAEVFQSLDPVRGVSTQPVSIDGASADVIRTVALRLPEGARVEQPGVTVRVLVSRTSTSSGTGAPATAGPP